MTIDSTDYDVYIVSGKSIKTRMDTFLNELIPSIGAEVKKEEDKIDAIHSIQVQNAQLMAAAIKRKTPVDVMDNYTDAFNECCSEIMNKDCSKTEDMENEEMVL